MKDIYCNKCFRFRETNTNLEFSVSRCGHLLCKCCLQRNCPLCGRPLNPVPIGKEMPLAIMDYFKDEPLQIFRHFQKVCKFQYDQERRLVEHLRASNEAKEQESSKVYEGFKKIQLSLEQRLAKERERTKKLREYIAYHERRSEQTRYMTPPITAPPRPRYPARRSATTLPEVGIDFMPQLTKTIRSQFAPPHSPTLSTNDDSSIEPVGLCAKRIVMLTQPALLAGPNKRGNDIGTL